MPKLKAIAASLAVGCAIVAGCKSDEGTVTVAKSTNTYVVVVGMEKSAFVGNCPGAGLDADRMYELLKKYTSNIVLLKENKATKSSVVNALYDAVEKAGEGLVVFYYSGHGGSDPFPYTGLEEVDGKDEYLCLWDIYLRDNDIWDIIKTSKGRFFMICDACHSQTMWRAPGFRMTMPLGWDHNISENHPFSMLCWSGCPDSTFSYGSSTGGQFTNALLKYFEANKTYAQLWEEIKGDKILKMYENPQSTAIGGGFEGKTIFR